MPYRLFCFTAWVVGLLTQELALVVASGLFAIAYAIGEARGG